MKQREWLVELIRGLHMSIGITAPPPEQTWIYTLVWSGVCMVVGLMMLLLFVGIRYQWF
jgi:hypothetical protein